MSSIGSALNSTDSSLLSGIGSSQNSSSTSSIRSSSTTSSDRVDLSQVGKLFKDLQRLQSSDPVEFKQILTDVAKKFQDAASKAKDPNQAKILNDLAARFEQAASSDDLTVLTPAGASSSAHGYHLRQQRAASTDTDSDGSTSQATTSRSARLALIANLLTTDTSQNTTRGQTQSLLASLLTS